MADTKRIKLVVWDLDNTLWEGTLTEGGAQNLRPGAEALVRELDRRGIVQSIASKNDYTPAMQRLEAFGLADFFLCPQISWNAKSQGIRTILSRLNIKPEATAFLDDSPFERDEVRFAIDRIRAYDPADPAAIAALPEFTVEHITQDAANRRKMYRADLERQSAEEAFTGDADEFLATLHMQMDICPVTEQELQRVEELTIRTHQLNSTGYTYSYDELLALSRDPRYIFRICGLKDDYGESGRVGLILLEDLGEALRVKLLIVSCRVMSRGIGTALLCYATQLASRMGKKLQAEFIETEYNRIMYITYKLSGFEDVEEHGDEVLLEYNHAEPLPFAACLNVTEKE